MPEQKKLIKKDADEQEKKELEKFNAQLDVCANWRKKFFEPDWYDAIDAYNAIREPNPYPYKQDLTIGIIRATVETFLSKICAYMPQFTVGNETKGGQDFVNKVRNRLKQLWHITDSFVKLVGFEKQALILGTTAARVRWRIEQQKKRLKKKVEDSKINLWNRIKEDEGIEYETIYDDPDYDLVDLFDLWFQPEITDLQQMRFSFYQEMDFMSNLKAKGDYYKKKNIDKIEYNRAGATFGEREENQRLYKKQADGDLPDDYRDDMRVRLMTRYSRDATGKLLETVVANRNIIIRGPTESPIDTNKVPFVIVQNYYDPFCIYGEGEPRHMRPIQDAISDLYNAIFDNIILLVNQMWVVNDFADINTENLIGEPGGIVKTHSPKAGDAIQSLPVGQTPYSAFRIIDNLRTEIRNLSGDTVQFSGEHEEGMHRTSSGLRLLAQQSVERFGLRTQLLERLGVKKLAELFIDFDRQHILRERNIPIHSKIGTTFETISPEMYEHRYHIEVITQSMVSFDENAELDKAIQRLDAIAKYAKEYNLDLNPLIQDMLEKTKFYDVDSVMRYKNLVKMPSPEVEHYLIMQGIPIEPQSNENFGDHIEKHEQFLQSDFGMQLKNRAPEAYQAITVHLQQTYALMQQVQQQLKTREGMQPAQQTEQVAGTQTRMENM
jgi:hypothetical protein